jgi:hypothetical protein
MMWCGAHLCVCASESRMHTDFVGALHVVVSCVREAVHSTLWFCAQHRATR